MPIIAFKSNIYHIHYNDLPYGRSPLHLYCTAEQVMSFFFTQYYFMFLQLVTDKYLDIPTIKLCKYFILMNIIFCYRILQEA